MLYSTRLGPLAVTRRRKRLTLESTPDCKVIMGLNEAVSHAAKIGQVANATGLSIDTIRFYEKQGLLKRSPRTEGGSVCSAPATLRL